MFYEIKPEDLINAYKENIPDNYSNELQQIYDDNCSIINSNIQPDKIYTIIDNLWTKLFDLCTKYNLIDYEKDIANSLKYEILAELLNTVAVQTGPLIDGIENFLKKGKCWGYTDKSSALPALRQWLDKIVETDYKSSYPGDAKYTVYRFINDDSQMPDSINNYFHSRIIPKRGRTNTLYSFKEYSACLTNTLLRFFKETAALYPSQKYLAYNSTTLYNLFSTLHEMYCNEDIKSDIAEKLPLAFHAEQLFHFSYFKYGFNFLSSNCNNVLTEKHLSKLKDFFYTYYLTSQLSSEVLKLYYLKFFCENQQKYFLNFNGISTQHTNEINHKLCLSEFIAFPFIKSTFQYWIYSISQNNKLIHLGPSSDKEDNMKLLRLSKLITDYMNADRNDIYYEKSILNSEKLVDDSILNLNDDFKAFILHLSKIYSTNASLNLFFSCSQKECLDNLRLHHCITETCPNKLVPNELLAIFPEPYLDYFYKTIYNKTFPFNEDYMNYLFFTTYPRLT